MKYIDADLLREKIAEQMKSVPREVGRGAGTITSTGYGMMQAFQIVRSIIDSLQQEQPKVDLEKEIEQVVENYNRLSKGDKVMKPSGVEKIARHFYEHGKNSK